MEMKLLMKLLILGSSLSFLSETTANAMINRSSSKIINPLTPNETRVRADLMDTIKNEATLRRIAPINARIDEIWKAIPGYNGIEIDVEKTYELNKGVIHLSAIQYLYKEIKPQISLGNLGAQPIHRGNPSKPLVSFMINVAWGNEYLPHIREVLKKHHAKTTFFLDGSWLKKNIDLAKDIAAEGHELSNHAYSHKNMSQLDRAQAIREITRTEQLLVSNLNVRNTLFAPPSGDFDMETVKIAKELNLKTILWTLDTVDWRNPTPQSIVQKIENNIKPGYLILMHPTKSSSQALDEMITVIERKGLRLGTVSEVISESRVPNQEALKNSSQIEE
ncbi:polysaccharide deacetylase family protein [Paenibacillus sp. SYP-B3998]|uniref:Polysaccharide deacetylase family protein n=1 Tax=Paenibacillus sp. SYP-B3998 TaxID=2678564 RepID=A0A6G3ZY12_9BACL|nr:polysaccharide deacetylase family protein [Paenibacillus sp. SYP-B3998]NEW06980.1 polysaccharide deacetylase family protein [Paenibacillus sp. SYP-B3998]